MGLSDADTTSKIVGNEIGISDIERQIYPILAGIWGNEIDPVDHKTLDSVRLMLLSSESQGKPKKHLSSHNNDERMVQQGFYMG